MAEVLYYKIEVDTGDSTRKLLGEMTAQLKSINDEYKQLISAKDKDTASIGRNREQYAALTKDINTLSKSIVSSQAASEKDAAEKIKLANEIKNTNNKLEEAFVKSEMAKAAALEKEIIAIKNYNNKLEEAYQKSEQKAREKAEANTFQAGSIAALRQELSKATLAYDRLGKAERDSAAGKQMEQSIAAQVAELNKLEQATGRYARQVGNYNTAGVAMSQVLREIPAFTYSAQTGILALSNNIPILVDEMRNIAEAMDGVTGKKAGWGAAFMQMGKNLFSLGGVMTIALGLFTIFSDKIIELFTNVVKLTDAQKKQREEQEKSDTLMYETINSWKVYNGEITKTEASLRNLAYANNKELQKIKEDTKKELDEINSFYGELARRVEGFRVDLSKPLIPEGDITPGLEEGSYESWYEEQQAKIEAAKQKQQDKIDALNKKRAIEISAEAVKDAQKIRDEIEKINAGKIADEYARAVKMAEIKRKEAYEETSFIQTVGEDRRKYARAIDARYQAEIDAAETKRKEDRKKKEQEEIDRRLKEEEAYYSELQKLVEQWVSVDTEMETDKYEKLYKAETESHRNIIDELKSHLGEREDINKQVNKNIAQENKRHYLEIIEIALTADYDRAKGKGEIDAKIDKETLDRQAKVDAYNDKYYAKLRKKQDKQDKDRIDTAKVLYQYLLQAEQQFFRMKEEAIARSLKREEAMIEASAETQQNILKNRLDKGIISEAQYNADKNELDKQTQEKKLAAQKEAFEKEKKLALAQIAVNTALGISNVWATPGTPLPIKIAQTAGIVAINALQAAAVNAQEFATGGLVKDKDRNIVPKANGDSVLATLTPGEVVLNERQQQMLGGASTFAKIGVPGFTPMPNSASGGSVSSISKKEFQAMFSGLGKMINSKKVYQLESENKRVRESVQSYESNSKW